MLTWDAITKYKKTYFAIWVIVTSNGANIEGSCCMRNVAERSSWKAQLILLLRITYVCTLHLKYHKKHGTGSYLAVALAWVIKRNLKVTSKAFDNLFTGDVLCPLSYVFVGYSPDVIPGDHQLSFLGLTIFRLIPRPHGRVAGIKPSKQLPGLSLAYGIGGSVPLISHLGRWYDTNSLCERACLLCIRVSAWA